MENTERELIEESTLLNVEVRRLYSKHRLYESRIGKMGRRPYLTQREQLELSKLKILKLRGVEQMLRLVKLPATVS